MNNNEIALIVIAFSVIFVLPLVSFLLGHRDKKTVERDEDDDDPPTGGVAIPV